MEIHLPTMVGGVGGAGADGHGPFTWELLGDRHC